MSVVFQVSQSVHQVEWGWIVQNLVPTGTGDGIEDEPLIIPDDSALLLLGLARKERILLVDDELMIRNLGQALLKSQGYDILMAENGQEAFDLYRTWGDTIDLVLLDLRMPGWSGQHTLSQLRLINPYVPCLVISGFSNEEFDPEDQANIIGFLRKPFRPQEYLQAVQMCLTTLRRYSSKQ